MKRFIFSILFVSIFFVGLGALVEKTGAKFKSDEKALDLVRKARLAIGGDSALVSVQSLIIAGQTTRSIKIDGVERAEQGETEIALQLPDKLSKTIKIGHGDEAAGGKQFTHKQFDVVVVGADKAEQNVRVIGDESGAGTSAKKIIIKSDDGTVQEMTGADADKFIVSDDGKAGDHVKRIIIKKPDGSVEDLSGAEADKAVIKSDLGDKAVWTTENDKTAGVDHVFVRRGGGPGSMKQNELLRFTLSLLLTAPQGMDVSYTFGGESSVDGTACNIVNAEFAGATYKIFLGQSSNLPVMMVYKGMSMPKIMTFRTKDDGSAKGEAKADKVFTRMIDGPVPDMVEYSVKFSDYRAVSGVQLPFRWTQTVGGAADETFDVTSYEINPANIAEKFQKQKVILRTKAPEVQ